VPGDSGRSAIAAAGVARLAADPLVRLPPKYGGARPRDSRDPSIRTVRVLSITGPPAMAWECPTTAGLLFFADRFRRVQRGESIEGPAGQERRRRLAPPPLEKYVFPDEKVRILRHGMLEQTPAPRSARAPFFPRSRRIATNRKKRSTGTTVARLAPASLRWRLQGNRIKRITPK
jgi:hypothetical protein